MTETTISELEDDVQEFCEERDWDQYHDAKELAIGISTEAAELLEHFRFQSGEEIEAMFEGDEREEIENELADVLFFVLRMSQRYDIDLETAFDRKMKLNQQKYPVNEAYGSNRKYTEY